jgi:hypothetical protein
MELNQNIFFLGIAEYIQQQAQSYPIGNIDLFQLSKFKIHIIYPALAQNHYCVFLIKNELLKDEDIDTLQIDIVDEEG